MMSLGRIGAQVKSVCRTFGIAVVSVCLILHAEAQSSHSARVVHSEPNAKWHLKGDGMVCCPCKVPCPCRSNGRPSYGHCEATLYLRIRNGRYNSTDMSGMNVVETAGMCATKYQHLSALYFDRSTTEDQRTAYMKIAASLSPEHVTEFPYVRTMPIQVQSGGPSLYSLIIPGVLEIVADRNWGLARPPLPFVAATDTLANEIQYAKNIRYRLHDSQAGLDFNYDGRQANYRIVDLNQDRYPSQSMLIQFADGSGWFDPDQLLLIERQKLTLPDLEKIQEEAIQLRKGAQR